MKQKYRHLIQLGAALLTNANLPGFLKGRIWQGNSKAVCVPGLNCYSCPGAVGACPIGALQASLTGNKPGFPYYVVGFLLLFGALFGRLICGFLCPIGFLQDLLYKIRTKKLQIPERVDRPLRYLKYVILLGFVIGLPLLAHNEFGIGDPWFCKYICPAGTLEGGIPLLIQNEALRSIAGVLFSWKMLLLIVFLVSSMLIYRPFCKYICPLGAIYGLFNKIGFYRLEVDRDKCIGCKACEKACRMQVKVLENINSTECIRCGVCREVCPKDAIGRAGKKR